MKDLILYQWRKGLDPTIDASRAIPESIYLPGPASGLTKLLKGIVKRRLYPVTEMVDQMIRWSSGSYNYIALTGNKSLFDFKKCALVIVSLAKRNLNQ